MVVRASRRQTRQQQDPTEVKLDAVLDALKQNNELLTLLVKACVRTVQVPAGSQPPPNAVRVDDSPGTQVDPTIAK
jgi:hypothetical protein